MGTVHCFGLRHPNIYHSDTNVLFIYLTNQSVNIITKKITFSQIESIKELAVVRWLNNTHSYVTDYFVELCQMLYILWFKIDYITLWSVSTMSHKILLIL